MKNTSGKTINSTNNDISQIKQRKEQGGDDGMFKNENRHNTISQIKECKERGAMPIEIGERRVDDAIFKNGNWYKRFGGVRKVGAIVEDIAKPAFKNHGFANHKLITYWPHIIGSTLAKFTIPQKISFPPNKTMGGILYIGVTNPSLSLEIQAQESKLIEKISVFFGYQAIRRIKLSIARFPVKKENEITVTKHCLTPEEAKEIEAILGDIKDNQLRQSLEDLASTMFKK